QPPLHNIEIFPDLSLLYQGPPLEEGPLPSIFYFAISKEDSLRKDPFNQFPSFLKDKPIRIFSATLPAHEPPLSPEKGIFSWAEEMRKGEDPLTPFFQKMRRGIAFLLNAKLLLSGKIAACGLSRGAFIACHIAALCPEITAILGFAPLTRLTYSKAFEDLKEQQKIKQLDLETLIPFLYNRAVRFYVGSADTLIGTENAFSFIHKLAAKAYEMRLRTAPIELIMTPSIGREGHGTAPHTFQAGAKWIETILFPSHD
ncbi:MAG: hypothetical protein HYZ47_03830, partial [Simkania negevensis]|nr:hypothetical protein [Simkania negevensis]